VFDDDIVAQLESVTVIPDMYGLVFAIPATVTNLLAVIVFVPKFGFFNFIF